MRPTERPGTSFVVRSAESLADACARCPDKGEAMGEIELPPSSGYFRWKSWLNRLAAGVLLIPTLPILGLLWVVVRVSSPGPGLYRQIRVGYGGKAFYLLKLRTMDSGAEEKTGPVWTEPDDPRITRLGRLLRKLHLDELPQLFNVLKGEMDLVGPRPERPEFVPYLAREIPDYMQRYAVLPGITGLAQINLPPDTDLESVHRKLVLDLEYIRQASPWMDARILACTSLRLIGLGGLTVARLTGLARLPIMEELTTESPTHEASEEVRREDHADDGVPTTYRVKLNGHAPLPGGNARLKAAGADQVSSGS